MKCEKCGLNNATTHIKTVVNGVVIEKNLCQFCAADFGYDLSPNVGLSGMLASMFGANNREAAAETKQCPVCGALFSNIAQSGKVGCAECYKTFKVELLPYLKRVHSSVKHIGKVPCNTAFAENSPKETVEDLRKELARLISVEDYEQAAVIRDKIKEAEANG